jgi:hypothetical protein
MLSDSIAALETLAPAQLRDRWEQAFGEPSPWAFGPDLLARAIAYRMQEKASGGMPRKAARELARLGDPQPKPDVSLRPGTRLARDWHGRTHHVLVVETGFHYRDRHYRSLTAIAREITGAAWSGPRFFGLTAARGGVRA